MYKFIDLFAGIGGFRIAAEEFGWECVFSSEIDKAAARAYYENFKDYPLGDITKIDEKDIPSHDILCAGFPCQPFSVGGYRKGFEDTRGTLFFDIARILAYHQPRFFILENVPGLVTHDNGKTFEIIKATLKELGYMIWYDVLNGVEFGVPHNRRRIFIVGFREKKDFEQFNFKIPNIKPPKLKEVLDFDFYEDYLAPTQTALKHLYKHLELKGIDINSFDDDFVIASEIRPSRAAIRLNPEVMNTLPAKMGTGGNNVPLIVTKNFVRKMSVKEGLRLLGFPEWFRLKENYMQSYKQIGNSLIVPIVREIFKALPPR